MTDVTSVVTVQITVHSKTNRPYWQVELRDDADIIRDFKAVTHADKIDILSKQLFLMEAEDD